MGERGSTLSGEQKLERLKKQIADAKSKNTGSIVVDLNELARGRRPKSSQPLEFKKILRDGRVTKLKQDQDVVTRTGKLLEDELDVEFDDDEPPSF